MACYFPFYKEEGGSPLPCGKCPYCLARRVSDWCFRCIQEAKTADSAHWCTLTYANPPLSHDKLLMTLYKRDVQNFFKRLRKIPRDYSSQKIKYYVCGEYGEDFQRPHYHAVIFNSDPAAIVEAWRGTWSPTNAVLPKKLYSRYKKVSFYPFWVKKKAFI